MTHAPKRSEDEPVPAGTTSEPHTIDITPDYEHLYMVFQHDLPIALRTFRELSSPLQSRDFHAFLFAFTLCLQTATKGEQIEQLRVMAADALHALSDRLLAEDMPAHYRVVTRALLASTQQASVCRTGLSRLEAQELARGLNLFLASQRLERYLHATVEPDDDELEVNEDLQEQAPVTP